MVRDQLHPYQKRAINFQCDTHASALWMDMGLGKTIVTLTSIAHLKESDFLTSVLVVAPLRVIHLVWEQEARKWEHTRHLTFSIITGTPDQRISALMKKADIYLINYEGLRWLVETLQAYFIKKKADLPFNGVVWDEIAKMKNSSTHRVKAFMKIFPEFKWRTGLTGTPASNGYGDLHGQYLVLDGGKRLGTSKWKFREHYYYKMGPYIEVPYKDTPDRIKAKIQDITLEMSAEDYNPLPDFLLNDIVLDFPPGLRKQYENLEKDFFFKTDEGVEIEVFNAAALTNKLIQFSNGFCYPYPEFGAWEAIHNLKIKALEEVLDEAGGSPVLCAYAFRADAERIMAKFSDLEPINLTQCKTPRSLKDAFDRWESGDCALMIGHPGSVAHGIDRLQHSGHILCWFGVTWSLDLYDQFNARIRRQGQGVPVICHRILMRDTMEQAQLLALENKAEGQASLKAAINQYRRGT